MVSLGNNSSRQGGYFFDQEASLTPSVDDQEHLIIQQLGAEQECRFKSVPTVCISVVQALLFTLMTLSSYILPYVVEPYVNQNNTGLLTYLSNRDSSTYLSNGNSSAHHDHMISFSLLIYIHAAVWLIVLIIDRYIKYHHHNFRKRGYLEFCRQTKNIRRVPLAVISAGTVVLLVVVTVVFNLKLDKKSTALEPVNYMEMLITLEFLVALPCILIYMNQVMKFNKTKSVPDVEQDDMMSGYLQSHIQTTDVGFKDTDHIDDVLEKQADMIRYLQQHNAHLGRRILKLTASLPNRV
ncbi:transmembrane protein 192-like [Glandiceps talaboti]